MLGQWGGVGVSSDVVWAGIDKESDLRQGRGGEVTSRESPADFQELRAGF